MCVLSRAAHVRAPLRHRGAVLDQAATAVILDLQRVRSAIARNACKHLLSDDALEPPPNLLKAVACIRNGKWCSLHWRYLIDLEDKGTPADPLKSFKGDNGRGAENFSLCVNRAIAAIALVDPMSASTAIPYLNELAQIVSQRQLVERGRGTGNAHDSNLRRTASPWLGRFSACANVITWPATSLSAASV